MNSVHVRRPPVLCSIDMYFDPLLYSAARTRLGNSGTIYFLRLWKLDPTGEYATKTLHSADVGNSFIVMIYARSACAPDSVFAPGLQEVQEPRPTCISLM